MIEWQPGQTIYSIEKIVIEQAFKFYRGNKTQTANSLGIAIRTLDSKLEKYDSDRQDAERTIERLNVERNAIIDRQRGITSSLSSASTGLRMEPLTQATTESKLPMSERKEVQEVLSRQAPKSSAKRAG